MITPIGNERTNGRTGTSHHAPAHFWTPAGREQPQRDVQGRRFEPDCAHVERDHPPRLVPDPRDHPPDAVVGHTDANTYALLITALLERGAPMTLSEVAERFEAAGVAHRDAALASLKRCRPARAPVYRDGDTYGLDPYDDELDLAWTDASLHAPWSAQRLALAVLDANGGRAGRSRRAAGARGPSRRVGRSPPRESR